MAVERMDCPGDTDTPLAPHNASMRLALRQKAAQIHLLLGQNMNFGHSLAEAPAHRTQVVVRGSLCHSPGSPLEGPRLMVVPVQGVYELAILAVSFGPLSE